MGEPIGDFGFDFIDDRCRRRLKRKKFDIKSFESCDLKSNLNACLQYDGIIDKDYHKFLRDLCGLDVSKYNEVEKGSDEDEDSDPDFQMFLKSLREDGNSYVLSLENDVGVSQLLKFEGAGESSDEDEYRRKSRDDMGREKVEGRKHLGRRDEVEKLKSFPGKEKGNLGVNVDNLNKKRVDLVRRTDNRKNPKSLPGIDGRNSVVGKNLRSDDDRELRRRRNLRAPTERKDMEGKGLRNFWSRDNVETKKSFVGKERKNAAVGNNLRSEHLSDKGHLIDEFRVDNCTFEPMRKCDTGDDKFDSCYEAFLNSCVVDEGYLVLINDGRKLIYEKYDEESSSDSDIMMFDKNPDLVEMNYTPVLDSKVHNPSMGGDDLYETEDPQFRKELVEILRKSYNQEEYERLLHDVEVRKLTERHRELRRGIKSFQGDTYGKSYLDYYADLRKQYDAVKSDKHKMLNVLRGFFYWLQNMSNVHVGGFKPWLDKSCLAILPGSH